MPIDQNLRRRSARSGGAGPSDPGSSPVPERALRRRLARVGWPPNRPLRRARAIFHFRHAMRRKGVLPICIPSGPSGARSLASDAGEGMVRDEGDQSQMTGALNGHAQRTLVLGAYAGASAGLNLGAVRHEPPDLVHILVIDDLDVFDAEGADTASRYESPTGPTTRPPAGAGASRSATRASAWRSRRPGALWCVGRSAACFCSHRLTVLVSLR